MSGMWRGMVWADDWSGGHPQCFGTSPLNNCRILKIYQEKICCRPDNSRESQTTAVYWQLPYAYQALFNTIQNPQREENASGSDDNAITPMTRPCDRSNSLDRPCTCDRPCGHSNPCNKFCFPSDLCEGPCCCSSLCGKLCISTTELTSAGISFPYTQEEKWLWKSDHLVRNGTHKKNKDGRRE